VETDPRVWYNLQGAFQRLGNFSESLKGGWGGGGGVCGKNKYPGLGTNKVQSNNKEENRDLFTY
jgi:hypothetical protein